MKRPVYLVLASLALVVTFFVLREHWGHALGFLPYALLLACPLLHFFHHGGHGRGDSSSGGPNRGS
ncbi:MAG: DUF2933 domain-containing protein [Phenylobacterium sp.]|nr:DUF2933 domain-containing protein [Phenylobacterium sp.]MDP3853334.1 DUF2933 domain-containing protein [Phenylobacterium sp.]